MTNAKTNKTDRKKQLIKLLSAMLVILMTLALFAACSAPDNGQGSGNSTNDAGTTADPSGAGSEDSSNDPDSDNAGSDAPGNDDAGNDDAGNDDVGNDDAGSDDAGNDDSSNNDVGGDDVSNDDSSNSTPDNNDTPNGDDVGNEGGDLSQEPVAPTYSIKEAAPFSDGVAYVTLVETSVVDGTTVTEEYQAFIDTMGAILHKFTAEELEGVPLNYELRFYNGVTYNEYNHMIYDKKFNVLASPETHGYDAIVPSDWYFGKSYIHDCGYFLVYKTEEAFTGDKFYVGVLDTQGNYTIPLSEEHPIAALMAENNVTFNTIDIEYIGDGYYEIGYGYYYNILTNKITSDYSHYRYDSDGLYKIDENGDVTVVFAAEGEYRQLDGDIWMAKIDDHTYVANAATQEILIDFGEAQIGTNFGYSYYNGYFLATTKNQNATAAYCSLYNSDGELAFEPVRMGNDLQDKIYALTEEGFLLQKDEDENTVLYFYDYEGNSTVLYSISKDYIHGITVDGFQYGWALIRLTENWSSEYKFVNTNGESMY